jgi:hypothetical protein
MHTLVYTYIHILVVEYTVLICRYFLFFLLYVLSRFIIFFAIFFFILILVLYLVIIYLTQHNI